MPADLRVITGAGEVADDLTALPSKEAELVEVIVRQQRQIAALKGEITKLRKVDPDAEDIQGLLEHWKHVVKCDHVRVKIPPDGVRWKVTKARLADDFTVEQLRQVIDVAAELPFERFGQRFCEAAPGRVRRDDLPFLFANEARVEALLRLADGDGDHRAYRAYVWRLCQAEPIREVLAMFAELEPHGEVLAAAARWAKLASAG